MKKRVADFCAVRIDVLTIFAVMTNVVLTGVHYIFSLLCFHCRLKGLSDRIICLNRMQIIIKHKQHIFRNNSLKNMEIL